MADANVEHAESRAAAAAIATAEEAARDAAAAARPLPSAPPRTAGGGARATAHGAPVDRPACAEAVRRLKFFQSSLDMAMPDAPPLEAMDSVTVLTPAYKETVIFSVAELAEEGSGGESLLDVLRRLYADEWRFFCERTGVARDVTIGDLQRKGGGADATAVRGASLRGQTLTAPRSGWPSTKALLRAQAEQPGLSRPAALELVRTKFEMLYASATASSSATARRRPPTSSSSSALPASASCTTTRGKGGGEATRRC